MSGDSVASKHQSTGIFDRFPMFLLSLLTDQEKKDTNNLKWLKRTEGAAIRAKPDRVGLASSSRIFPRGRELGNFDLKPRVSQRAPSVSVSSFSTKKFNRISIRGSGPTRSVWGGGFLWPFARYYW